MRFDDAALAMRHEQALENGAHAIDSIQRLTDPRRFDVPTTVIATESRTADVRRWMAADRDPARELAHMRTLRLLDLPSGRWPQIERSDALAALLLDVLPVPTGQEAAV